MVLRNRKASQLAQLECLLYVLTGGKRKRKLITEQDVVQSAPTCTLIENKQQNNLSLGDDLLTWLQASSPAQKVESDTRPPTEETSATVISS